LLGCNRPVFFLFFPVFFIWGLANFFCPGLPGTVILLILAFWVSWDDRHMLPCLPINWVGVSWTLVPSWPQTVILPILVSQVANITGLSHQHLARIFS
jgi:hypothetical protein